MLKAAIFWLIAFAFAAVLARAEAWRWAFQLTMPFPQYDDEQIYRQIRGRVFSRLWLFSALAGATCVAPAMLVSNELVMLALLGTGVLLIVGVSAMHAYRLFHVALA